MKNTTCITILLLILPLFACKTAGPKTQRVDSDIVSVQWGKSFGMCRGYCYYENTYRPDSLINMRKGWQEETHPPVRTSHVMTPEAWNQLVAAVNVDSFFVQPERIGCPDCADGGAEWIEVRTKTGAHRVTIEFGSEQPALEPLLSYLRAGDVPLAE